MGMTDIKPAVEQALRDMPAGKNKQGFKKETRNFARN